MSRALSRIAQLCTRLLATDTLAAARLRELEHRLIELRVNGIDASLFVAVDASGLLFATAAPRAADVTLEGKPTEFIAFARARRADLAIPAGTLRIQGDLGTAQTLQRLLDELEIDWEAMLADALGDVPAHQLGRGLRAGLGWLATTRAAWREDLTAFLQTERRLVPVAREIEDWSRAGLGLVNDVERLALRVARLRERRR